MGKRMNERTDGGTDRPMDGCKAGWIVNRTDGWMTVGFNSGFGRFIARIRNTRPWQTNDGNERTEERRTNMHTHTNTESTSPPETYKW